MYLTEMRARQPGPGDWPTNMALWIDAPTPDVILDEIDATLNSWNIAHHVFGAYQGGQEITLEAYKGMTSLVHKVINDRLRNSVHSYPPAVFTWALLERWIRARGRPVGYEVHLGNRMYLVKDGRGMGGGGLPAAHYRNNWYVRGGRRDKANALVCIDEALERAHWLEGCHSWAKARIRRECGMED